MTCTRLRHALADVTMLLALGRRHRRQPASPQLSDGRHAGRRPRQRLAGGSRIISNHHMHSSPHLRLTTQRRERPGDRQCAAWA